MWVCVCVWVCFNFCDLLCLLFTAHCDPECRNGGVCLLGPVGVGNRCVCPSGFTGSQCEQGELLYTCKRIHIRTLFHCIYLYTNSPSFLYTVHHSCILYIILVYCTSFLYTVHHSCILYIILVYVNPFLYTISHSCILYIILVYVNPFLYTISHSCKLYIILVRILYIILVRILYIILVYCTSLLYTIHRFCILYIILVYYASFLYTIHHSRILYIILVYCISFLYTACSPVLQILRSAPYLVLVAPTRIVSTQ